MGERFSNRAQYVWKEWTKLQSRETERNREYALLEIPEVTRGFTGSKHSPPGAPVIDQFIELSPPLFSVTAQYLFPLEQVPQFVIVGLFTYFLAYFFSLNCESHKDRE